MQNGGYFRDKHRSYRAEAGFKNELVFRNVDDPHEIIVWGRRQADQLRRGAGKPRAKAAMKEAVAWLNPQSCMLSLTAVTLYSIDLGDRSA
jgi:hypothetical protein